ncbi:MAG: hypothetical protein IPO48_09230 [Saprospiraceae bacterium]|nr:hypothetical protein [Saprospiraceae bacterium]
MTTKNTSQLNEYFNNIPESKIGILTNGLVYEFYCRNIVTGSSLHPTPFYTFNWENIEGSQIDNLSEFYSLSIDVKSIIEKAQASFSLKNLMTQFLKNYLIHLKNL